MKAGTIRRIVPGSVTRPTTLPTTLPTTSPTTAQTTMDSTTSTTPPTTIDSDTSPPPSSTADAATSPIICDATSPYIRAIHAKLNAIININTPSEHSRRLAAPPSPKILTVTLLPSPRRLSPSLSVSRRWVPH